MIIEMGQRLADLFVPLFRVGTATPETLIDAATKSLTSTETALSLGLVALVLTLSSWRTSSWRRPLTHLLVLMPFIGSTLGVITLSEAYGVFALEVIVWLGLVATSTIGSNIIGFFLYFKDETIGEKVSRLFITPIFILILSALAFAAFFSATMVGGMVDFGLQYGSDAAPRTTAANYQAHHDQIMRIEHRCLGLPKASEDALKSAAEKHLARFESKDFHSALGNLWQNHIIWGACSASNRSSAPWFMLLCLLGLLAASFFHPGFDKNSTPNGVPAAAITLSSLRLIFVAMAPSFLANLPAIGLVVMFVLAVQRGVSGVFMPAGPKPKESQRSLPGSTNYHGKTGKKHRH